jgi:hypothetical protein
MAPSPVILAAAVTDDLPMDAILYNHRNHLQASISSPSSSIVRKRRRKEVAVFVKVLLDYLERTDPALMQKTKKVRFVLLLWNLLHDMAVVPCFADSNANVLLYFITCHYIHRHSCVIIIHRSSPTASTRIEQVTVVIMTIWQ